LALAAVDLDRQAVAELEDPFLVGVLAVNLEEAVVAAPVLGELFSFNKQEC
jgi:hypothetical protein